MFQRLHEPNRSIFSRRNFFQGLIGIAFAMLPVFQLAASGPDPDFRLVGTMPVGDRALAIIELDGRQVTVREGDTIDACVIEQIDKRRIHFRCDDSGHSKRMTYSEREPYASGVTGHQVINVDRGTLVSAMQNRQQLVSQITLVPEVADNRLTGYRVSYLAPDGDLAGMGIRENDLILSVNGAPASEPAGFMRSIDSLAEQSAFSIQIAREDRFVSLDILLD